MMTAMMLPTIFPERAPLRAVDVRDVGWFGSTMLFAGGYVAVWASTGVVPLAILTVLRSVTSPSAAVTRLGGAIFVVVGLYELSALKERALAKCARAEALASSHAPGRTATRSFLAGVSDGGWCLVACGTLTALLLVVGVMNLVWMVSLTTVFVLEKRWRHTRRVSVAVGVALFALGAVVLAHPSVLDAVVSTHHAP
jgi:predicted metal-binding membrane protein